MTLLLPSRCTCRQKYFKTEYAAISEIFFFSRYIDCIVSRCIVFKNFRRVIVWYADPYLSIIFPHLGYMCVKVDGCDIFMVHCFFSKSNSIVLKKKGRQKSKFKARQCWNHTTWGLKVKWEINWLSCSRAFLWKLKERKRERVWEFYFFSSMQKTTVLGFCFLMKKYRVLVIFSVLEQKVQEVAIFYGLG